MNRLISQATFFKGYLSEKIFSSVIENTIYNIFFPVAHTLTQQIPQYDYIIIYFL